MPSLSRKKTGPRGLKPTQALTDPPRLDLALAARLEHAYQQYHVTWLRSQDPVSLVHEYSHPQDQEVAAWIVALLAYGNVATILSSARRALSALGPHPSEFLRQHSNSDLIASLGGFRHRFTNHQDLAIVFAWCHYALQEFGSLERAFARASPDHLPLRERLAAFVQQLFHFPLSPSLTRWRKERAPRLNHLVPDPLRGSACKRLNLFLRWVVRPADGIDLGLWKTVHPSQLILPLDTHLMKTVQTLGWTQSRQPSWQLAEQATRFLRALCPGDPVRYDFALCHLSMEGGKL